MGNQSTIKEQRNCPICGTAFWSRTRRPKYHCSRACKDKSGRTQAICRYCKNPFEHFAHCPRIYCSNKCRGADNRGAGARGAYIENTICKQCGTSFTAKYQKRVFCSNQCQGLWASANNRGVNHPNYGKPSKKFSSKTKSCLVCQKPFIVKRSIAHQSHYCSRACNGKAKTLFHSGTQSNLYKGGRFKERGPSWSKAKRLARERDVCCQHCGIHPDHLGRKLDVHHIKPFRLFGIERHLEANDLSNLICLCANCHTYVEWRDNR